MSEEQHPLALEDFERVDWQATPADDDESPDLLRLSRTYRDAAQEAEDATTARVLGEIRDLCSLRLRPEESRPNPLIPLMRGEGFRTAQVGDLDAATVAACCHLADTAPIPRLRARMADVAWVVERDYESAQLAHEAYLKSSKQPTCRRTGHRSNLVLSAPSRLPWNSGTRKRWKRPRGSPRI